jgi:hypothetical protein
VLTALLSDDQATSVLRSIIFHCEAIPWTVQFVYQIHCIWCKKGWTDMVEILPEDLFRLDNVIDSVSDQDVEQVFGYKYCFDLDMKLDGCFNLL